MNNFTTDALDITQSPYRIVKHEYVTSFYMKQHFGYTTKERNLEKLWEQYQNSEKDVEYREHASIEYVVNSDLYKEVLLRHVINEPCSQKEVLPNWVKFMSGETISISGNIISVTTTSMNYSNLENFVSCILKMQNFKDGFMKKPTKIEIDWSSVTIENLRNNYKSSSFFYDDFERQSPRYDFDIHFNLLLTLKEPIEPKKSLKKYAMALKGANSPNYIQILCDALEYPGKFAYAPKSQKMFLKPESFEEASDYFVKRYNTSKKNVQKADVMSLRDKIATDPLSYIDDKDEIISDFANVLLSGI